MKSLQVCGIVVALSLALGGAYYLTGASAADGDAASKQTALNQAPGAKAAPADPNSLEGLLARRDELAKKLQKLQADYAAADQAQRAKLEQEFDKVVEEYRTQIAPNLIKAALPAYLKDGENELARDVVFGHLQEEFIQNKYRQVAELCDRLIAAGRKEAVVLNFGGVANFAIQEFEKAQAMLKEAETADPQIFGQLGRNYLASAGDYIELWKKEQEIRAREAKAPAGEELPRVVLKTSKGDIELELFENEAPNTVANFVNLVEKKYYDGIAFHRVLPNFMAQGGDPNTRDDDPGNDGTGGPGYTIACECYREDARMHFQGSLSMAKTSARDTGGSQFFLTHLPTPHLNGKHTVFGRITKGLDTALALRQGDVIESATVTKKRNHPYVPKVIKEGAAAPSE